MPPLLPDRSLETQILAVLAQAQKAPFYQGRLPALTQLTPEAWAAVPLTTKLDLRRAYPFGLLAVPRRQLATYHESSGTTGEPTSSYLTDNDWDDIVTRFNRNAVGIGPDDTVLVKTPYSMVTTGHQMHLAARRSGALVVPADNRSSNMTYGRVIRLLRDLPVTVAWCMPTEVALWHQAARLAGLDPQRDFPSLRAFLVAGEGLSPARRQRLSDLWGGKPIHQDYGSTETGSLAGECSKGNLHLWSDRIYSEVFDAATGRTSDRGVGQLVVTTLGREAMPLVRYLVEDMVRITPAGCDCGSEHPTIEVMGRLSDQVTIQGTTFYPGQLEDCVYSLPLAYGVNFWRSRYGGDVLEVEIDAAPGRRDDAVEDLTNLILLRLGVCAVVRVVEELLPRGALTKPQTFLKPRFVFKSHEDWRAGLTY